MSIASNTAVQYTKQQVSHGIPGGYGWTTEEYRADKSATQAAIAGNYQTAAENMYTDAISGLQSLVSSIGGENSTVTKATDSLFDVYGSLGTTQDTLRGYANELGSLHSTIGQISDNVNPVFSALTGIEGNLSGISSQLGQNYGVVDSILSTLGGIGENLGPLATEGADIQDYLTSATENAYRINQYSQQAAAAAGGITNQVNDINMTAGKITTAADSLGELSPLLKEYGESMYGTGSDLINYGRGFLDQAQALMNMDGTGGGLVGEYISAISSIDPNKYVSQATADVTAMYANQLAQQNRDLARSGVDAGSARSVALRQQLGQAQATASAAAKFRARQTGNAERLAAIRGAVSDANALAGTGTSITSTGVSAQSAGANAIANAANVLAQQGSLYSSSANAQAAAGNLLAAQANAYTNAGQLESAAGNLQINAANAAVNNAGLRVSAANAQTSAANAQTSALQTAIANANAQANIEGQRIDVQNAWLSANKQQLEAAGLQNTVYGQQINAQNSVTQAAQAQISALNGITQAETSQLNARVNAATALANAQMQAGAYYNEQASDWGALAGSGSLMDGLFPYAQWGNGWRVY